MSPDGRWLAYTAREGGGRDAVFYVQPYPSGGAKWQVSRGGGMQPVWRKDGRELYFVSPERNLMAVAVKPGGADFAFGQAERLMAARTAGWEGGNAMGAQYAATADGQRFLIQHGGGDPADQRGAELGRRAQTVTRFTGRGPGSATRSTWQ